MFLGGGNLGVGVRVMIRFSVRVDVRFSVRVIAMHAVFNLNG